MPEVIFPGPAGRLEGYYHPSDVENAPLALVLSPHPQAQGHMNQRIPLALYDLFQQRGFNVLRFNYRGVGHSQGAYDQGAGELADAASALDWLQSFNKNTPFCWTAGYSFGAWVCLQLLMRRPEIEGFLAISPPTNTYDLSFLAPCPSSGLVLYGTEDSITPHEDVTQALSRVRTQKGKKITPQPLEGADHFYRGTYLETMLEDAGAYLDEHLDMVTS